VSSLETGRAALALIASIAIRPCTGALFVLVIAARFDAFAAGCLAVLTMGLGTAAFNLIVAAGGTLARQAALLGQGAGSHGALRLSALFHIFGGGLIVTLSFVILAT
jgi:ABC-type nickel/cobalt efflux system permease component RcnA